MRSESLCYLSLLKKFECEASLDGSFLCEGKLSWKSNHVKKSGKNFFDGPPSERISISVLNFETATHPSKTNKKKLPSVSSFLHAHLSTFRFLGLGKELVVRESIPLTSLQSNDDFYVEPFCVQHTFCRLYIAVFVHIKRKKAKIV